MTTPNLSPEELDRMYDEAAAANKQVAATHAAYLAATTARKTIFRKLRAGGQTFYAMAKRLGLSRSRVEQIVSEKKETKP